MRPVRELSVSYASRFAVWIPFQILCSMFHQQWYPTHMQQLISSGVVFQQTALSYYYPQCCRLAELHVLLHKQQAELSITEQCAAAAGKAWSLLGPSRIGHAAKCVRLARLSLQAERSWLRAPQMFLKCVGESSSLTNQNSIQQEIKIKLKSGNACYHSVQNLLSSIVLSKNLKIKIYRTIIWFLSCLSVKLVSNIREKRRLRVFENWVFRRMNIWA